jgi:hypothetical protein
LNAGPVSARCHLQQLWGVFRYPLRSETFADVIIYLHIFSIVEGVGFLGSFSSLGAKEKEIQPPLPCWSGIFV